MLVIHRHLWSLTVTVTCVHRWSLSYHHSATQCSPALTTIHNFSLLQALPSLGHLESLTVTSHHSQLLPMRHSPLLDAVGL